MQAITTKYIGPTDHKGSRIIVKCQATRITVAWDDALGVDENHLRAAERLARKLGWDGTWHGGSLPDGTGNVYVLASIATFAFTLEAP